MRYLKLIIVLGLAVGLLWAGSAQAVRIKDMASVQGVRGNQLIGYGLVVGLNGTGDGTSSTFTAQGMANMLNRMGIKVTSADIKSKNVAAVMVTAELPPFGRAGQRVDVLLSSMGDAKSLAGGTLVMTPLKAINGQTYAVAQGPVSVGGFAAGGDAASVSKNHPTVGRIPRGGSIEREVDYRFGQEQNLTINLNTPDFTTANRVANEISTALPGMHAQALDPSTVQITLPEDASPQQAVRMMAQLENLDVKPDASAKVVVDERTGTVVMGENVRISTVAVASGALSISVSETPQVSQALPFAQGGQTVVTPQTQVKVGEEKKSLQLVNESVSISEVVKGLNALGATPRDLISILQAIKAAGALQADLEII